MEPTGGSHCTTDAKFIQNSPESKQNQTAECIIRFFQILSSETGHFSWRSALEVVVDFVPSGFFYVNILGFAYPKLARNASHLILSMQMTSNS